MTEIVGGYRTLAQVGPRPFTPAPVPAPAAPFGTPGHAPTVSLAAGELDQPDGPPQPTPEPQPTPDPVPDPATSPDDPSGGDWRLPGLPMLLPAPGRVLETGSELFLEWHPRDPNIRMYGNHGPRPLPEPEQLPSGETRQPSRPGDAASSPDASDAEDRDERSGVAKAAMLTGIGGGFVMNAIDVARLVKKYPEAMRAGQYAPELGKLGRLPTALSLTAQMRVDSRIVDPLAPRVASAASLGRSFTRFDELAMRSSVLLGASLAAIQIGSAIPNIIDAVSKEGPWHENLLQSTSGRFGLLQLGGGLLGSALFATALRQTAGQAGEGVVARILAAGNAPIMARPMWGRIGIGTGLMVAANEFGYFDMFNTGETRTTPAILRDAAHSTPVLNDSGLRTAALLAVGGVVGFKAHRAVLAAGSIGAMPKGHWIAGAAVAGLVGTQLLGGLSFLDKPGD